FAVIAAILGIVILGGTFAIGLQVGEYRSASRSFRRFREAGFPPEMIREMRPNRNERGLQRHGFGGEVLSVGEGTLTVLRRDGTERTIAIGSGTQVLSEEENVSLADITIGTHVVAIGKTDESDVIHAKVLMVPPAMEQ
ncbi:hypothetical protein COU76_05520, partial [Candidatus Peregrinibacteria bacterium CG10_big_fil_rev_8_21_14_0_10_49_10]